MGWFQLKVEQQDQFCRQELEPRIAQAKAGQRTLFLAAHFVLAPFLGFLWSLTRLFIKAPTGRQRFNVLGALNALTLELITVTNDSYINANTVCELLSKIAQQKFSMPITAR